MPLPLCTLPAPLLVTVLEKLSSSLGSGSVAGGPSSEAGIRAVLATRLGLAPLTLPLAVGDSSEPAVPASPSSGPASWAGSRLCSPLAMALAC